MDLLVIIINDYKSRKAVKAYLREIGLGDFIVMQSSGTSSITQAFNSYRSMIDLPFDSVSKNETRGKTIFVTNKDIDKTQFYLDEIALRFKQDERKGNSGIAFSIPINSILT